MSDLDTHIRALLGDQNDPAIIKKAQRIGQKCQNNKTFEKILSHVAQSKSEEPQKDESKQTQEKKEDKNEELYARLAEKRDAVNKAKKALDEKLGTLNDLASTKTRLLDEYTLGLSQTSSESMMEPMMKLKKYVKNEEELQASENKCENLNKEIKEKTQEAHESLEKLTIKEKDSQDARPEDKSQKIDDSYAEKLIREFIESKRRSVLEDLENREVTKEKINERRGKYDQIRAEFAKTLEAQEPYLRQKIEDSVQKTINIEEKKATVKKLQELASSLKSSQSQESAAQKQQETKSPKAEQPKETAETKAEEGAKDDEIAKLITQNKDTLRHVQASKIRINEFVANNTLAGLEEVQKVSKGLEANFAITFENWEKIYMLPADVYYTNMAEENYSPILQEMMNLINKPNKAYFYLPKLIKKIATKIGDTSAERLHLENAEAEEELKTNQRAYQQKKRKQISELVELSREFESEILYKERLENLLEMTENPPAIACADILRQYEGWTLSDYIAKWKRLFGPLSKEDYCEMRTVFKKFNSCDCEMIRDS